MSSVNYNLGNKGVRLIPSEKIWEKGKNGNFHLSKNYKIIGKMDVSKPNMIVSVTDKKKPTYKGDVSNLNRMAKKQIIEHFFDESGKRNKKTVAYFAVEKDK